MRLCLINSAREWGGAERMFQELAAGFVAAGHEIDFVTRPATAMADKLPTGVARHALAFAGDLDVATTARLHRLFRRRRPQTILCNFGRECWLASFAARPLGIPVVQIKGVADQRLGARARLLYRHLLARVICVSEAVRNGFAGLGVSAERFVVVPNGLDVAVPNAAEVQSARNELGWPACDFVIAYSGRLNRDKGCDLLPAIVERLRGRGVPARLVIVGEGELRRDLERDVQTRGLADAVHFTGFVEKPLPYVVAANAALIPSRWTEAFGLVAVEALAVGTPTVAARTGGLAEILADGETALLVERDDVAGFVAALERLWRSPELAEGLRRRGRERATDFSRARMIAAYEAVLRPLAPREEPA